MTAAQRHRQKELNLLTWEVEDYEAKGKKLPKKLLNRVKFVAACIQAHAE